MKHWILAAALSACVFCGSAADVVFPLNTGDVSLDASWGGTVPGTGDTVIFSNGVYTASANRTFGSLVRIYNDRNKANVMTFDLTANPKVTLSFDKFYSGGAQTSTVNTNWFKGGTYDFQEGPWYPNGDSGNAGNVAGKDRVFAITDGAVVTNVSTVNYRMAAVGQQFRIDGADSAFYSTGLFYLSGYADSSANGHADFGGAEMRISNGGRYHGTERFFLDDGFAASARKGAAHYSTNRLVVVGKDSYFESNYSKSGASLAMGGNGDYILVSDHAQLKTKRLDFGSGNPYCSDFLFRAEKDAVATLDEVRMTPSGLNVPSESRFEVLSGATVTNNGVFYVGGYNLGGEANAGNTLYVSNATFRTYGLFIGDGVGGSNNTVVVSGSNSVFEVTGNKQSVYPMFTAAPNCTFIIENNATFAWPYCAGFSFKAPCTNETIRVQSGGTLTQSAFVTGNSDHQSDSPYWASSGNRLEVFGGKVAVQKWLCVSGEDGVIALSNGVAKAGSMTIGYEFPTGTAATNGLVDVCGDLSRICLTNGNLTVDNGSKLRIEVPSAGYAETPITVSGNATWNAGCALEIINTAALREYADANGISKVTLIDANRVYIPEEILSAARAGLAEGCTLKIQDAAGGRKALNLGFKRGLMLIFR